MDTSTIPNRPLDTLQHLNRQFFDSLINLDTFSRLPPNTDIHLSKSGYFAPNAGKLACIIGAQTVSNIILQYTPAQMLMDIDVYFTNLAKLVEKLFFNHLNYKIILLHQYMNAAYGDDRCGLYVLLTTYQNHYIYTSLYTRSKIPLKIITIWLFLYRKYYILIIQNYIMNVQQRHLLIRIGSYIQTCRIDCCMKQPTCISITLNTAVICF